MPAARESRRAGTAAVAAPAGHGREGDSGA